MRGLSRAQYLEVKADEAMDYYHSKYMEQKDKEKQNTQKPFPINIQPIKKERGYVRCEAADENSHDGRCIRAVTEAQENFSRRHFDGRILCWFCQHHIKKGATK